MITKVCNNFGTSGLHGFGGNLKSREKKRMTVNEKYVCYHVLYCTVYSVYKREFSSSPLHIQCPLRTIC